MLEAIARAAVAPGLGWLILAIAVAGVVRGFTGFGTALVFVPVATIFLAPAQVIALVALTGIASNAVVLPRAWKQGSRAEVGILVLAALVTVPLGLALLDVLDAITVRWVVAAIATVLLGALVSGWRHARAISRPELALIGAAAGVVGGLTGLTGPVVILFYLSGQAAVQSVRANTILFLAALDVALLGNLLLRGEVTLTLLALAFMLAIPYGMMTVLGQAMFDPRHERIYRRAAYGVIALAVLSGLPLWNRGG